MRNHIVTLIFFGAMVMSTACAGPGRSTPNVETLNEQGRRLLLDRSYEEAVERFAHSMRIEPSAETAAQLADCHERLDNRAQAEALWLWVATETTSAVLRQKAEARYGSLTSHAR